jgi:hypothetical protein
MYEESLTDQQFVGLDGERQSQIIAEHCLGIQERIRNAQSRHEAERVAAEACSKLEQECPGTMVRRALIQHIQKIVEQYWPIDRE